MRYKLNMGYKKYKLCKGYKMDKEVEEVLGIQQGGRREVGKGVQVVIMMRRGCFSTYTCTT